MNKKRNSRKSVEKDDDPFDIWMTLGVVIGGRTRHLELFLTQIKNHPDLKLVYTKTSAGKLTIKEVDANEQHDNKNVKE